MNRVTFLLVSFLAVAASCSKGGEQENKSADTTASKDTMAAEKQAKPQGPELVLKWTTDTTLTTCESVLFDSANKVLYVSNINGKPDSLDKNGFISKVSLDGKVENLKWATGNISAPKGMGLYNGKLYVTDINALVEIDVKTGKVGKRYPVQGAKFLNDVVVDKDGTVYFTDSGTNKIHTLKNGKVAVWKEDNLNSPNGVYVLNGKLYLASYGSKDFKAIDLATKKDSVIATNIGEGDGVEFTGRDGYFVVSSWEGEVFLVTPEGKAEKLLDTKNEKLNSADIGYDRATNTVFVPTFFGNKVQAYELKF